MATGDEGAANSTPAGAPASSAAQTPRWVVTRIDRSRFRSVVEARSHVFALDEPLELGGTDAGPTPYEAMLAALGACTAMTLRMYADRRRWPLDGVIVRLRTAAEHELDCEVCETEEVGPHVLERDIELEGELTAEQRERLLEIAERCPVKQTFERGIRVENSKA